MSELTSDSDRRREPRATTNGVLDARLATVLDAKVLDVTPHGMSQGA
jgi:hypothetical protein